MGSVPQAEGGGAEASIARLFGPGVNSTDRAEALLREMTMLSPAAAFSVLAETWSSCDDTWPHRRRIETQLRRCRRAGSGPVCSVHMEWLKALPETLTIYRGCTRRRMRGLSWTLDRTVAEGFARGHRGIRVRNAVVASARVEKADVLFATNDRNEAEILVAPADLMGAWASAFAVCTVPECAGGT